MGSGTAADSSSRSRFSRLFVVLPFLAPSAIRIEALGAVAPSGMTAPSAASAVGGSLAASKMRVAVVGGGAAGLVTARALTRNGIRSVTVLEKDEESGGVWRHEGPKDGKKDRPMYRGLRTNLPREIMAFREKPWGGDGVGRSYVTHGEVLGYLNDYKREFGLTDHISYGCRVTHLTVEPDTVSVASTSPGDPWPKITLEWERQSDSSTHRETFDAVCVCNGHYASPSTPFVPGLDNYKGSTMHSIQYDDPSEFVGKVVLCVGAHASGSDLAREISEHAETVYLSDSGCPDLVEGSPHASGNVMRVPRTERVGKGGEVHFGGGCTAAPNDIDVIIFCTGYDYSFPFIKSSSKLELSCNPGERRVSPLYEQLWHAKYPNVAFVGLPWSVVPFPLFELQSEAIAAQLTGTTPKPLPSPEERMKLAISDAEGGGPNNPGRVEDTHNLGSYQWDYCRKMAELAGLYDVKMENFIATNKAIYDHAGGERKSISPGGPDTYRSTCYARDDKAQSFKVLATEMTSKQVSAASR